MNELHVFQARDGINKNKLNENFENLRQAANSNEQNIQNIVESALLKDGSNMPQSIIDKFNSVIPKIISDEGNIDVNDGDVIFLTLTGNGTIVLPEVPSDQFSHTIIIMVAGGNFSLSLGTDKHIVNYLNLDPTKPYNVMYIYSKLDNSWYYSLTQ